VQVAEFRFEGVHGRTVPLAELRGLCVPLSCCGPRVPLGGAGRVREEALALRGPVSSAKHFCRITSQIAAVND
jgi:hypothetical protein